MDHILFFEVASNLIFMGLGVRDRGQIFLLLPFTIIEIARCPKYFKYIPQI